MQGLPYGGLSSNACKQRKVARLAAHAAKFDIPLSVCSNLYEPLSWQEDADQASTILGEFRRVDGMRFANPFSTHRFSFLL